MANDSTNTTPVDVKTIFNDRTWDNLLSGIAAIQGKNFEKIKQALNEQQRASEQQGIDEEVRSINAERNNRAVNNALFGKLDKQVSVIDKLTDCLKEIGEHILDMLKNMAKQSLRAYDDAVRGQRQQLLTTKQIKENTLKADYGREYLEKKGIKISGGEISSLLPELAALGEDISTLSKEQLANMALLKKTAGVDTKTALLLARSVKNQEAFTKFATNASDTTGRATTTAILSQINEAWYQRASMTFGSQEEMLTMIQNTAKSMDSMLGHYGLSADSQKNLINTTLKLASGQIEKVKEDEIANALMISGDAMRSPEKMLAGLENLITNQNMSMSQKLNRLRVLENVEGIDQSIIEAVTLAIKAQAEGKYKKKGIRSEEDNKEAINQAQGGGKLGGFIDSLISGVNIATGGVLSDLSATLNEYFGENASMEAIVSTGFKMAVGLLATIAVSQLIGNPLKLICGAISKGILGTAGSILARLGAGLATKLAPLLAALGPIAAIAAVVGTGAVLYRYLKRKESDDDAALSSLKDLDELKRARATLIAERKSAISVGDDNRKNKLDTLISELDAKITVAESDYNLKKMIADKDDNDAKGYFEYLQVIKDNTQEKLVQLNKAKAEGDYEKITEITEELRNIASSINYGSQRANTLTWYAPFSDLEIEDLQKHKGSAKTLTNNSRDELEAIFGKELTDSFTSAIKKNDLSKAFNSVFPNREEINASRNAFMSVSTIGASAASNTFVMNRFYDSVAKGINNIRTYDDYKAMYQLVSAINEEGTLSKKQISSLNNLLQELRVSRDFYRELHEDNSVTVNLKAHAKGGIVDKATPALVGEAGKEAILPLTRKNDLARVLLSLSNDEKLNILKAILGNPSVRSMNGIFTMLWKLLFNEVSSKSIKHNKIPRSPQSPKSEILNQKDKQMAPLIPDGNFAPGDDPDTINKILAYATPEYRNILAQKLIDGRKKRKKWFDESLANASNMSGRELIKGTYAERALAAGVSQLGKPYILRSLGNLGYVCNELTDYAMRKSGFDMKDFHIYSVRQTFSNLVKGRTGTIKRGDHKGQKKEFPEFRLRPDLTPETAPPGMVFFSKKNKDALPGHIGLVYYNHKILHSSGGSSNYTPDGFLEGWQTPCRGVSVTDFNKSQHYEFGEFPGLFEKANGEFVGDINSSFGPMAELSKTKSNLDTRLEEQQRMAKEAMNAVIANTSGEVRKAAMQYAEQAMKLLDGKNTKEVIDSLGRIIQYLRSIATSTKPPTPNVSRAPVARY